MPSEAPMENLLCKTCGITFYVPRAWIQEKRDNAGSYFCPNGHQWTFRESRVDRLAREVAQLRQREAMHEDEKTRLRAEVLFAVKARKRIEKRVGNGACPHCNRTFQNVALHMKTKHGAVVCDAG